MKSMPSKKTDKIILPEDIQKPEQLQQQMHSAEGKLADAITAFAGSMGFVYLHAIWFAFWIGANAGLLKPFVHPFDPFPYGLLTMLVSLEAIFLSTFILISQNRQALLDTYREFEEDQEQKEEEKEQEELEQDVEEIGQDVEEVGQDVQEIGKDVDEMQKDLDEIRSAVLLIQEKLTSVEKSRISTTPREK
jgi:uncharacterized membrane protein